MTRHQDPKRFYRVEAREILDSLSAELLGLSRGESHPDASQRLFRLAHTLKGAATVVGDTTVAEMARILEDVLGVHRDSGEPLTAQETTEFLRMVEGLDVALTNEDQPQPEAPQTPAEGATVVAPTPESLASTRVDLQDLDGVTASLAGAELQASALLLALRELDVTTRSLGRMIEQQTAATSTEVHGRDVRGLRDSRYRESVRDVLDRLGRARRGALARADAVAHQLQLARERVGRLELVPATAAFPAVERAAQLAASAVGKVIRLEVNGGEVRLDRHVLPVVNKALLHIVRNAVDHGIEEHHTRAARFKPKEGRVKLSVERRGSRVAFVCEDDGGGIDAQAVRRLAVERGIMAASEAEQLDDAAALRLLFRAGVSTRSSVTDLSGRGVGLDVVGAAAATLHGDATITSELGVGTRVELVVPVSLSTASVAVLRVEQTSVLMPLDAVRSVLRLAGSAITASSRGEAILNEGELLSVLRLGPALGLGASRPEPGVAVVVVVVSAGSERFAVVAEGATAITEVVVRPLPWAAGVPLGVAGAALDVEGVPHLVLDPRGLLEILKQHAGVAPQPAPPTHVRHYLPILVIDDSLTTRMLEQSILQTAGFEVDVATSAEEGLTMAEAREYGLFVVDVEMPGMNGFEFTALTRADNRFKNISVILVTSLSSEADQQRGREAGASAYVVKGQFDQDHFLNQVRTLSKVEA
jgi:two-component system chemotaxis sensor kinase CheA